MEALKQLLWKRWGSNEFPAEWDGIRFGGGKGSQRYWEYLWVVDQLDGNERKILDVGAGENAFLPRLLANAFEQVEAVDPALPTEDARNHRMDLGAWISQNPSRVGEFDCVTCVSVIEHLQNPNELFSALAHFAKAKILITLELGYEPPAFSYQLTMHKIYAGLNCFDSHYLTRLENCPVWADNSNNGHWRPFGLSLLPKLNTTP